MIDKLHIKNYKIHADTELSLGRLTVLTGTNASGKSSVLQSLLLLRQSYENNVLKDGLQLSGDYCNIGLVKDALYQYADNDAICFELMDNGKSYSWEFELLKGNNYEKNFIPLKKKLDCQTTDLNLFNNGFQYISAARSVPSESHQLETYAVESKRRISQKRGMCELVVQYLYYYGIVLKEKIKFDDLCHGDEESKDLLSQVSAWEREISSGVNVVPRKDGTSYTLYYNYSLDGDDITNDFRAENVGFGLSYVLPIIVALLSADKDGLILIENPEAHLHPRGQSKLAELIALSAQCGVQIIVETHSDHILNGLLVSCKKYEEVGKGIDRKNVSLYFFDRKNDGHGSNMEKINVLQDGKIDKQPEGFFDQTDKDLNYLLGF